MHNSLQPAPPICSLICISDSSALHQEWSRFKAGQLVSTERFCRDRFGQRSRSPLPLLPSLKIHTESDILNAAVLPDRALVERCARLYMRSMIRATFPILDPYLFEETVRLAYDSIDHEPSHIMSAKACVIAFSIFSYLVPFGIRLCSTSKFNYYNALLQQLLHTITEAATLDGFQACVFLVCSPNSLFIFLINNFKYFTVSDRKLTQVVIIVVVAIFHRQVEIRCSHKLNSSAFCLLSGSTS